MSERAPQKHEQDHAPANAEAYGKQQNERVGEKIRAAAESAERAESNKDNAIEKIQERIEKSAVEADKTAAKQNKAHDRNDNTSGHYIGGALKAHSFKQTMKRTQKRLNSPERAFSKVVHQPVISAVSDAAEGTVARPSGLLFAGLFSAIASIVVLYICRHYGFEYNFTIGLACLGLGFIAGIILEGFYKAAFARSRA